MVTWCPGWAATLPAFFFHPGVMQFRQVGRLRVNCHLRSRGNTHWNRGRVKLNNEINVKTGCPVRLLVQTQLNWDFSGLSWARQTFHVPLCFLFPHLSISTVQKETLKDFFFFNSQSYWYWASLPLALRTDSMVSRLSKTWIIFNEGQQQRIIPANIFLPKGNLVYCNSELRVKQLVGLRGTTK